jgi:predicted amidohydrolase
VDGIHVAVAQAGARVGDVPANVRLAGQLLGRAAARGAHVVVLPECFVQGYSIRPGVLALAEASDGPAATSLAVLARRHGIAVVVGFIERNPNAPKKPYNAALVIERDGRLAGVYRKTHLFGKEHDAFTPGDDYPVFDLRLRPRGASTRVGVCICADIEYPEVARLLALAGAQLIAVPSADFDPFRAQQAANLVSRAIENNLHVALANTVDRRAGINFFGGSGIAGPDGALTSAGYLRPRVVVAELSDAAVDASGGAGGYLRDRRRETYGALLDKPRR